MPYFVLTVHLHHLGACSPGALFPGECRSDGPYSTGRQELFAALHFGPRAGAHAVNLRILHLQREQFGEHIRWRINRRVVTDSLLTSGVEALLPLA